MFDRSRVRSSVRRAALVLAVLAGSVTGAGAETVFRRGNAGEPGTLDPHRMTNFLEFNIARDIFEGLLTFDAKGGMIPGAAQSWEVSADGLVYTFKLKPGLLWSDGAPLTAGDFVFALRRAFTPATVSTSVVFLDAIKNGKEIMAGSAAPDTLGVRAVDDATLELTLRQPTGTFMERLQTMSALPLPRHHIEKTSGNWAVAGKMPTNGAFVPAEWVPQAHLLVRKNDKFHSAKDVKLDSVYYYPTQDQAASLNRFRAGELDMIWNAGQVQARTLTEVMPAAVRTSPAYGTQWLAINNKRFTDRNVRLALLYAVDQEIIATKVLPGVGVPAKSFLLALDDYAPSPLPGRGMSFDARTTEAQNLMKAAGYGPGKPLRISFRLKDRDAWKIMGVAISGMLERAYIEARHQVADSATHDKALDSGDFDIAISGNVTQYPDPESLMVWFHSSSNGMQLQFFNADYDKAMDQAMKTLDRKQRLGHLKDAETVLVNHPALIPLYHFNWLDFVYPYVQGYENNPILAHLSRWVTINK